MELIDGAGIFLAFLILFGALLVFGRPSRSGNGISHHPYGRRYTDSPGADTDRRRVTGRDGVASIAGRGTR